ncbi:aminoacyl-tRNA deacylase [Aliikangiella coralliicola]|uniref:YbaK/EbsC family protein n=1 Tax=Aliikangiella coralliicola TaxID=2592383 RepID=A0A545UBL5_9GAMM|nr:YbaK/EbsC family protein [Aliikangiella coralliicola]TQV86861.1 YbaK/EbsC family protein [Aliikangiella coralliicola]
MYTLTPFEYLDSLLIDYTLVPHEPSFTAQETAESAHIKGKDLSKVIVVGSEQLMSMVVVPANCILLQTDLSRLLRTPDLSIVPEHLFAERFPECEVGAMPPFGKLYNMNVFLAKELAQNQSITFNGGTHKLLIKMSTADFIDISDARVISMGYKASNLSTPRGAMEKHNWHWV